MWGIHTLAISALCLRVARTTSASISTTTADRFLSNRYVGLVTYDGGDFCGWQIQPTKRCVQGVLNEVLGEMWQHPVRVFGASRTDKGVHARGQVIHFDLPQSLTLSDSETEESLHQINRMLPNDLKLKKLCRAPKGTLDLQIAQGLPWHAGENAISKHYSYTFTASNDLIDPMSTRYRANLYNHKATQQMDINSFQNALDVMKGTHDFKAFGNKLDARAKIHEAHSGETFCSVRTILSAEISELQFSNQNSQFSTPSSYKYDGTFYRIDVVVDGALYKMLRNIIAGCIEVSYDTMKIDELQSLLGNVPDPSKNIPAFQPSRTENRLVTAPACGLCLEEIFYNEKVFT